ncbi:MAG: hypothetical protein ACRCXZ_00535 [Patescibacteria group bacterium]
MKKRFRGKIFSILTMLILLLPIFVSFREFYPMEIRGVFTRSDNENAIKIEAPKPPQLNIESGFLRFFETPNSIQRDYKNEDYISIINQSSSSKTNEKIQPVIEAFGTSTPVKVNQPFEFDVIVRNQKEEALANHFLRIKSSYDVTINKKTSIVFVENLDPNLTIPRSVSVNYEIAKRLGLETKDQTIRAIGLLKE